MAIELPALPFEKNALEPHISAETLEFHYEKHHATYVLKLNGLIEGTEQKKAVGVELENGEQLFAHQIISNADVGITYNDLIGKEHLSQKLQKKLEKTTYSCTSLMLFLTVDMDVVGSVVLGYWGG